MLVISRKQIAVFDSAMLECDVIDLAKRMERDHPKELGIKVPADARVEFIRKSHKEAKTCNLRTKEQIYLFAEARLLLGPEFHKDCISRPDLVSFLQDSEICADDKANALSDELALTIAFASK